MLLMVTEKGRDLKNESLKDKHPASAFSTDVLF